MTRFKFYQRGGAHDIGIDNLLLVAETEAANAKEAMDFADKVLGKYANVVFVIPQHPSEISAAKPD
jgi:hypothetical protein